MIRYIKVNRLGVKYDKLNDLYYIHIVLYYIEVFCTKYTFMQNINLINYIGIHYQGFYFLRRLN